MDAWSKWLDLGDGVRARFLNAGHILGSGHVEVRCPMGGRERSLVFSGDVGRYEMPLHKDPVPLPRCDALVVESTYGDRAHPSDPLDAQICEPFLEAFDRNGVVLVPAFAVGRSQQLTLILRELINSRALPDVPIHIDSPMAINATRIYSKYLDEHHLDAELLENGRNRLFPRNVHFHRSTDESKELNEASGPRVIISSSGMLSGGRILHHLKRRLPDRKNLVALTGYQAAGTRGRALLEGRDSIRIHGRDIPVAAEVISISGLSAHADQGELLRWISSAPQLPELAFAVHGEPEASRALAWRIQHDLATRCLTPHLNDEYDLTQMLG